MQLEGRQRIDELRAEQSRAPLEDDDIDDIDDDETILKLMSSIVHRTAND